MMKKIFTVVFITLACCLEAVAYNQVRLVISEGATNQQLKEQIEHAVSSVMTEINRLNEKNSPKVAFAPAYIMKDAQNGLNELWANEHFQCVEEEIVERLLTTPTGYQVRGIPLIVNAANDGEELGYQEAVINFDKNGVISSFYYTIAPELYTSLRWKQMGDERYEVTDLKERMMILDYVEHFRTAYNQKDLKFLRQIFSDDALIITGKVIKARKSEITGPDVVYITQNKQQYLTNLSRVFKSAKYIKVSFDDVTIVDHPTIKGIYGVTVRQKWNSGRYSDEGYVFMVWDFRNPDAPQIHVRTWQPEYLDKARDQRISPNDVFTLGDFDI